MSEVVKIIKLVNGEELIGVVDSLEGGITRVQLPFILGMNERGALVMAPYMFMYSEAAERGVEIASSAIVLMVDPKERLVEDYKQACERATSHLVVPKKPNIIVSH